LREAIVNYVNWGLGELSELRTVRGDNWFSKKLERRILRGLERIRG